jgi:hypothetical protein
VTPASSANPTLPPAARVRAVCRSSQVSATMKAVAPARNATPARQAPPCSNASSKSSNATAVINAPEANASSAAVAAREGERQTPIHAPSGSAAEAITAKRIAWPISEP